MFTHTKQKPKENKKGDIIVALFAHLKALHQLPKKLAYFATKLAYDNFIVKNQLVINLKSPCLTIMQTYLIKTLNNKRFNAR